MKIAVPTNDGSSISEHFGRSAGFLIFEIENARITSREMKENLGQCTGDHAGDAGAHSHAAILPALAGCEVVICGGMGGRAAEALKTAGIREVVMAGPGPAQAAVEAYLRGELRPSGQGFCRCSH